MTRPDNPFRPGSGQFPAHWSGRRTALDAYRAAVTSDASGTGTEGRMVLISGPRAIGKTSLLSALAEIAVDAGWTRLHVPGRDGDLQDLVENRIPDTVAALPVPPPDSPDEGSSPATGSTATENTDDTAGHSPAEPDGLPRPGILVTVDDLEEFPVPDLAVLTTALAGLVRDDVPVSFLATGSTSGVRELLTTPGAVVLQDHQLYQLTPFRQRDATALLSRTAKAGGLPFTPDAAEWAASASFGHPYLVQLIGSLSWDAARSKHRERITTEIVDDAIDLAIPMFGARVHQPALAPLTHAQLEFLRAMCTVIDDQGSDAAVPRVRTSEIAAELDRPVTSVSAVRADLLHRDIIYSPAWGKLSFRLPYLREYLDSPDGPLEVY